MGSIPSSKQDMAEPGEMKFIEKVFVRTPFFSHADYAVYKLGEILRDEDFLNAVWLASPELFGTLCKKGFDQARLSTKERTALLKYYNRMSFRATPFGGFAAFSLADWGGAGKICLAGKEKAVLHCLPSGEWLRSYAEQLRSDTGRLLLMANPTMYILGDGIRFVRSVPDATGKMQFSVQVIPKLRVNTWLIGLARSGPVPFRTLAERLAGQTGSSAAEAAGYIAYLAEEQVLLDQACRGPVTFAALPGMPEEAAAVMPLPGMPEPGNFGHWKTGISIPFRSDREGHGAAEGTAVQKSFYTAAERLVIAGALAEKHREVLSGTIAALRKLTSPYTPSAFTRFKEAFLERFDQERVPLLLAVDPDAGIGYGELHVAAGGDPLLEGIDFPAPARPLPDMAWSPARQLLFRLWLDDRKRGPFDPIRINPADLESIEQNELPLPPGIAVMFRVSGDQLIVESAGGASSTALIGRFTVFSGEIENLCREITDAEQDLNPGVCFAEIDQRSHLHVDNINRRRPAYRKRIALNVFPGKPGRDAILPEDLLLSVRGDELILESKKLKKRIVPRLPTAYNYRNNELGVFRLLCDLQYQGLHANLTFDLEKIFPGMTFYPRVAFGEAVISPARWFLSASETGSLLESPHSLGRLHRFRESRGIPCRISMGNGDRQLSFDLENDEEAFFFLDCLVRGQKVILQETFGSGNPVSADGKELSGQFIAMMNNTREVYPQRPYQREVSYKGVPRRFSPGDEWLYLKVYCTPASGDRLLAGPVASLIRKHRELISNWFFIRYRDPGNHLRLRFRLSGPHTETLLNAFRQAVRGGAYAVLVRDYSTATYNRELERYDGSIIEAVEDLFCKGSELTLPAIQRKGMATGKWAFAFETVFRMAAAFFGTPGEMTLFFRLASEAFLVEFGAGKSLRVAFDKRYREISRTVSGLLSEPAAGEGKGPHRLAEMEARLRELALITKDRGAADRHKLFGDLVHMQVNRIFNARQRQHEALILYALCRYCRSAEARAGRQP